MIRLGGHVAKQTDAWTYWAGAPDDLEDAYVKIDGRIQEVWDCGVDLVDGKVALYGDWLDALIVDPQEPIYYSPPERWDN